MVSLGNAKRIGWRARAFLSAERYSGRVLAVVSNAAYLVDSDGEIVWLAQEHLPSHGRGILGTFNLSRLQVGMFWTGDGSKLVFERAGQAVPLHLEWEDAAVWQPEPVPFIASRSAIAGCVLDLFAQLESYRSADGLGQAIMLIAAEARGDLPATISTASPFVRAALAIIQELAVACRAQDWERVVERGHALVGLGSGLTPSGDDFLGGLLFVTRALADVHLIESRPDAQAVEELLAWAQARTNAISYTLLRDHAGGQSAEPLHGLVAALLTAQDSGEILTWVERLLGIGSSSGADMLAGALTGMLAVL